MISVNTNVNSHVDYIGYVTPVRLGLAGTLREDVQTAERASRRDECAVSGGVIAPACGLTSVLDEALGAFLAVLDGYSLADVLARRGDFSHLLIALSSARR